MLNEYDKKAQIGTMKIKDRKRGLVFPDMKNVGAACKVR
jgi:hypothetical protein